MSNNLNNNNNGAVVVVPNPYLDSNSNRNDNAAAAAAADKDDYDADELQLDPDAVRLRASSIPGCYEVKLPSASSSSSSSSSGVVCSFLVGCCDTATSVVESSSAGGTGTGTGGTVTTNQYHPFWRTEQNHPNHNNTHSHSNCTATVARVTIYCTTGTIATGRICVNNTGNTAVRHVFRTNVTSLDIVERCLRYPMPVQQLNFNLIGTNDVAVVTTTSTHNNTEHADENDVGPPFTEQSIQKHVELIDVGMAILSSERDKLVQHVQVLEQAKTLETEIETATATAAVTSRTMTTPSTTATATTAATTTTTGMEFQFSLSAGPMKHVDQCLHDIQQMGKYVKWVATNGIGTVFLYGNGGVAYTPNIPQALYTRLSQLRTSKLHSSRPKYVSLGTRDRYYVAFFDGTFQSTKGIKGLDRELKKVVVPPLSVTFGSTYDAFFIVYHDGSYKYQGRGIPHDLIEKLTTSTSTINHQGSNNIIVLSYVTLGPSGEWFVRSQDGTVIEWGGISRDMENAIQELLDNGHTINFLDFGENGSYFVSYD
jgi:hypothetical protein